MSSYPPEDYEIPKNMFVNLGNSGLKVSRLILGCMSFGNASFKGHYVIPDEEDVFKIMKACYDAGIRTFDTADVYSSGYSEILVGKFLKKFDIPRESIVIMTKVYAPIIDNLMELYRKKGFSTSLPEVVNIMGLSRKHIMAAVEASTSRLGTYIDVYQIHRFDPETPPEETMRALNDVIESGKVRYIGVSTMKVHQLIEYQHAAEKYNYHKFISVQPFYNLLYREEERETLPYAFKSNLGVIPWSPIAGGRLARPRGTITDRIQAEGTGSRYYDNSESEDQTIDRVEEIAKKRSVAMTTVATAWSLKKGCNPIIGINKVGRIQDAIDALSFELSDEEMAYLEGAYKPTTVKGLL